LNISRNMPRYLRIISLLETPCALCLYVFSILVLIFRCWTAAFTASCQQGGGHSHILCTHFMLFLCVLSFLFTHSSIFRERESSETILLFSDSGGSEVEPCEDGARPVTGSLFIGPRSLFSIGAKPKESSFSLESGGNIFIRNLSLFRPAGFTPLVHPFPCTMSD